VKRTGTPIVPFKAEAVGVEATPTPVPSDVGTVALEEGVVTTPATPLVEEVLGEDRGAEPEALVYDAKIAELADAASVTGQTVCRLLAVCYKYSMIYMPYPL
jgi:hypothetical protein